MGKSYPAYWKLTSVFCKTCNKQLKTSKGKEYKSHIDAFHVIETRKILR